jgi:proline iminopeptidase
LSSGLHVEIVGEGPPLLITHGGPGLHHGLYRTLDRISANRQLVYWDHRGHGRSAPLPDGPVDMSLFADDAVSVADELGLETFAVFGHSFGGWVAQELALRHPSRVSALVLAATTPGQLGETESPDDYQGPPMPADVENLLTTPVDEDADVVRLYTQLAPHFLRGADTTEFVAALDPALVSADSMGRVFDALSRWSSVDRLAAISSPTLVIAGRQDVFCSAEQLQRIARRVPGAELEVFEDCGHFMWLEDPGRFFPLLSSWLKKNRS